MGLPTLALALCLAVAIAYHPTEARPQSPSDTGLMPSGGEQSGLQRQQPGVGAGSDVQSQPDGATQGERRRGGRKGRRNRQGKKREGGAGGKRNRCRTSECKKERRLRRKQRKEQRRQRKIARGGAGGKGKGGKRRRKDRKQRPQEEAPAAGSVHQPPPVEPQN